MSSPTSVPPRPGSAAAKQQAKTQSKQAKQQTPAFKNRKQQKGSGSLASRLSSPWVIGGVIAVIVLVVGMISILSATDSPADTDEFSQVRPVTVTGAALPVMGADGSDSAIGIVAPTIAGASFDGSPIEIAPGRATLLVYAAHWCPHCQAEVPLLVDWQASGDVPAGLQVIGIATATDPKQNNYPPSDWLQDERWPWPVLADSELGEAGAAMGVDGYPFFVLLDAQGRVTWRASGEIAIDVIAEQARLALAG